MFSKTDSAKFRIMNFPSCLWAYRCVADEKCRTSFSFIAIKTIMVHNYNHGRGGQGVVIGVVPCYV